MKSAWLTTNVKTNHGSLGAMYPQTYISEGDIPSFLDLVNNGLEAQSDYTLGVWGGRSVYDNPLNKPNHVTDSSGLKDDGNAIKMFGRWLIAARNDFAARMDWCKDSTYSSANKQHVARIIGAHVRFVTPGQVVTLDATPTTDPDGNTVSCLWWQYYDADNCTTQVAINNNTFCCS